MRRDTGDAEIETGTGIDIGAEIGWSHASPGFSGKLRARVLASHEANGFSERGVSGHAQWNPRPDTNRGLLLQIAQSAGASTSSGTHALFHGDTLAGLGNRSDNTLPNRLTMRAGYGFGSLDGRYTSIPELGLTVSDTGHEYIIGWRLSRGTRGNFEPRAETARHPARKKRPENRSGARDRTPAPGPTPGSPRRPKEMRTLRTPSFERHFPRFLERLEAEGVPRPHFVKEELEAYLKCGRLEYGFLRVKCNACRHERLEAFSCKRRGFCPSCGARRMAENTAHLVKHVLPEQ